MDHTLGTSNGWYIHASFQFECYYNKDVLISSIKVDRSCMKFFYYFNADETSMQFEFSVVLKQDEKNILWTTNTTQHNVGWKLGVVSLDPKVIKYLVS